jgi:hypothetical protein
VNPSLILVQKNERPEPTFTVPAHRPSTACTFEIKRASMRLGVAAPTARTTFSQLDPDGKASEAVVLGVHLRTIRKGDRGTKYQPLALPGLTCDYFFHTVLSLASRALSCPCVVPGLSLVPRCRSKEPESETTGRHALGATADQSNILILIDLPQYLVALCGLSQIVVSKRLPIAQPDQRVTKQIGVFSVVITKLEFVQIPI